MASAQDILNVARSQLGICENPLGSNCGTPYHAWFPEQNAQWCAIFACWLFKNSTGTLWNVHTDYSGNVLDAGRASGAEVSIAQVQPGDVVIFKWSASHERTDHIGIVEARLGPTTFQTIEGNNHDCVRRVDDRTQGPGCLMWFVRPKYSTAPQPKPRSDDSMYYAGPPYASADGKSFVFPDCYQVKHVYCLHTFGASKNVVFHLVSEDGKIKHDSAAQNVTGHQLHFMDIIAAQKPVKGSFSLTATSDTPIQWGLREELR